ncbi:alpha-galactosidase [Sporanaerobium hydrogeniformans]|uniref:Alpha-galactosidase n=1 Tax=Sporanaerobium hydrogeniformans TaxID=3072179 RepID=A0AC61D9F8_9FIRM|nr:glycoside hydrolase family 36 protein [Sporanaerobium hydrogeniformans]PHV69916.1 alpha-galactosidase [Sporanaerobium hydrogeniformans]
MRYIHINENGIYLVFVVSKENQLKLLHFASVPYDKKRIINEGHLKEGFQFVQLDCAGFDRPYERHGNKYVVTSPGCLLEYVEMSESINEQGKHLIIVQEEPVSKLRVTSSIQFFTGVQVVRFSHTVENRGEKSQTLTYLSSFSYTGFEKEGESFAQDKIHLSIPHNGWQKELNWRTYTLSELGFSKTQYHSIGRTSKCIEVTNTGNWSTKAYLPMGFITNKEANIGLIWQIEHNGSWHYEIADQNDYMLLNVSGPTEIQSHWSQVLKPKETFTSVPVAVGVSDASFDQAIGELTKYRRRIRRKNKDNEHLPIIFNDYMNCLWADPTTEKELPLIQKAAQLGCEYYVIDAGWYDSGYWWNKVGEWKESLERFPNGIKEVTDTIRALGMIPGIWLELEVMGVECDIAKKVPDDWFFVRHGKRIYDRSRYQLDFRNPEVVNYINQVMERIITEYGVGYIKLDYNIEPGIGTELGVTSVGQGLLEHERAYLKWLDSLFERYPNLVIENCSSGGLRMDYALLARCSIQSTSDQEEFLNYAMISANAATGVAPEQAAIWSYPLKEGDKEEVIFNMVNALLLRIHQSGHIVELSNERYQLVKEGIEFYKSIRSEIKKGLPYWPLGLAMCEDKWMCYGCDIEEKRTAYMAVWKVGGEEERISLLPVPKRKQIDPNQVKVTLAYPISETVEFNYEAERGTLEVVFSHAYMARIFKVNY